VPEVVNSVAEEVNSVDRAGSQGTDVREHVREVDTRLRQVELDSIQDYIHESDNLVDLHHQIKTCDHILEEMEDLLGGFQADLGNISTEIKSLQEQSLTMSIKLRNRKTAEQVTRHTNQPTHVPLTSSHWEYAAFLTNHCLSLGIYGIIRPITASHREYATFLTGGAGHTSH
jgi:predicted  nucleic acid-binding Zn-ribbon protein